MQQLIFHLLTGPTFTPTNPTATNDPANDGDDESDDDDPDESHDDSDDDDDDVDDFVVVNPPRCNSPFRSVGSLGSRLPSRPGVLATRGQ